MYYYEVLVASQKYHGQKPLTYSSESELSLGQIVVLPLQRQSVMGAILRRVDKPTFPTKTVKSALENKVTVPVQLLSLVEWLAEYYPASTGQLMTLLLPSQLRQTSRSISDKPLTISIARSKLPKLTEDQEQIIKGINGSTQRMHLIHGDTGTGKTRVYIELIRDSLKKQLSCIVLTPEIGLTPQLAASLEEVFFGKVITLHSQLTPAERRNRWKQIAEARTPIVVIGPRSALFAPVHNLGLIIIDEAHDTAYKQEQSPYYVASRVAAKLAEIHSAKVILGTATPLIVDYYTFSEKQLPMYRMQKLASSKAVSSSIEIINLRDRTHFQKSAWLSSQMIENIDQCLADGTQALLFLNRRGSARLVLCQTCGWQATCPRCDVPLTYHADKHLMRCHTCGYSATTPSSCPTCNSTELTFRSIGTKALTAEIERLFPNAQVRRFDSDNSKEDSLEKQFKNVKDGGADIIVGTQLLAKGLDLPKLGLVGVVVADTGLYFPDYTAEERTYQLINQVIGRADRGHRNTKILVQTYHPDNQTLLQATTKDYASFYNQQLSERKAFGFPPFRYVLKIQAERASAESAKKAIKTTADKIKHLHLRVEISDPAPAFIEKVHGRYRWQLVIRAVDRKLLTEIIRQLPNNIRYDIDPTNLL